MGSLDAAAPARSVKAAVSAVRQARQLVSLGRGHKTAAEEELRQQGLLPFHLQQWNPFLLLPHMDFHCFPMDRLHGMYVITPAPVHFVVLLLTIRSELGVVAHFVTECVPAYYRATSATKAACIRQLEQISARVKGLTEQIPDEETVRGIFLEGGSKTGPQFRSAACVHA